jgi:hypothetical protein
MEFYLEGATYWSLELEEYFENNCGILLVFAL